MSFDPGIGDEWRPRTPKVNEDNSEIGRCKRRILDLEDAVEQARLELRAAEFNLGAEVERLARLRKEAYDDR